MTPIKITSVKLVKDGEKLKVKFEKNDGLHSDNEVTFDNVVHPDLKKAMNRLRPHLAILCSQLDETEVKDQSKVEKFRVNGYHIGGKEDQEGITIVGGLDGKHGYVGLNSPFTRLEGSEQSQYILLKKMLNDIKAIENEVTMYMSGEKVGAPELFPTETEKVTSARVAAPEGVADDEEVPEPPFGERNLDKEKKARKEKSEQKTKRRGRVPQSAEAPSGIIDDENA